MNRVFVFIDGNNFYFKLYVGIAKGQSFGLTKVSGDVRLLRPEEIKIFLPKSF